MKVVCLKVEQQYGTKSYTYTFDGSKEYHNSVTGFTITSEENRKYTVGEEYITEIKECH